MLRKKPGGGEGGVLFTLEMALLRVGLGAVLFAPKRRFMVVVFWV